MYYKKYTGICEHSEYMTTEHSACSLLKSLVNNIRRLLRSIFQKLKKNPFIILIITIYKTQYHDKNFSIEKSHKKLP